MEERLRCNCHICKVERHIVLALGQPSGLARFSKLALCCPDLATFRSAAALIDHLRAQRDGFSGPPPAGVVFAALISAGPAIGDIELTQSVLTLAFMPTIHRTNREIRTWNPHIPPEDIAQQILLYFTAHIGSAPAGGLRILLPLTVARSLSRDTIRWAKRQTLVPVEPETQKRRGSGPPVEDTFEPIYLLHDFLKYCLRTGVVTQFEHDLLIAIKIEGFLAKEASSTNAVLSEKAVQVLIQRIMKKVQAAAAELMQGHRGPLKTKVKNLSPRMSTFSLSTSSGDLALGISTGQLSLDFLSNLGELKEALNEEPNRPPTKHGEQRPIAETQKRRPSKVNPVPSEQPKTA